MPPTEAELKNPMIALRFVSGRASTMEALNMVLPAQLVRPAKNAKIHMGINWIEPYAQI